MNISKAFYRPVVIIGSVCGILAVLFAYLVITSKSLVAQLFFLNVFVALAGILFFLVVGFRIVRAILLDGKCE